MYQSNSNNTKRGYVKRAIKRKRQIYREVKENEKMGISNTLYHINWKYVNRLRAKKRGWKGNGIKNRNGN